MVLASYAGVFVITLKRAIYARSSTHQNDHFAVADLREDMIMKTIQ